MTKRTKILLVEPDKFLAEAYQKALAAAGYDVVLATGAQDAIHEADQQTPDLIILELQMAGHNGLEFLYEFRSYPEWQRVPVIINSLVPPTETDENIVFWDYLNISAHLYKPRTTLSQLIYAAENCLSPALKQ
ncbi:MAG: response regulator [Candidatus Saccharimonadales bacterium]